MKRKLFFLLICALFAGFLFSNSVVAKEETPAAKMLPKAPDFKEMDLVSQKEVSLKKNFEGNVLLFNFWATW